MNIYLLAFLSFIISFSGALFVIKYNSVIKYNTPLTMITCRRKAEKDENFQISRNGLRRLYFRVDFKCLLSLWRDIPISLAAMDLLLLVRFNQNRDTHRA